MLNKKAYFEWDVETWYRSMKLWDEHLADKKGGRALEIGSRRGGLSLMLAELYSMSVVCSDLKNPMQTASELHDKSEVSENIEYASIDCTNIDFEDNLFDVVVFKSVIGALGNFDKQKQAINEMRRVLKPGGVLVFAENMSGSNLHMILRKKFISWSTYWRYLDVKDLELFFEPFDEWQYKFTGFFSIFSGNMRLKKFLSFFDLRFDPILPKSMKYVVYGYAKK